MAFFKGRSKTQFRPLFLSLFSRLYLSNIDIAERDIAKDAMLADIVYFLERFFFIYGIVLKCQSKPLEKIVHTYAYQIENATDENIASLLSDLKDELAKALPDYVTFENAFSNLGYSRKNIRYSEEEGNKDDIKYILTLYEKHLRGTADDIENFSIEHIHKDTGTDVYCKIGNLVCLDSDENSKLGSKSASAKIPTYRASVFLSARKIAEEYSGKWEEGQITARAKILAKVLYEDVWHSNDMKQQEAS